MTTSEKVNFYLINIFFPVVCAVLIFLIFDMTDIDIKLTNYFYNATTNTFPLDQSLIFETITHKKARLIPNMTGAFAITGSILSFIWPRLKNNKNKKLIHFMEKTRISKLLIFSHRFRRDFLFVAIAFSVSTGCVHFLKSHTGIYCPVETTLYGGKFEKMEWYDNFSLLHDVGAARCWPGGHASSGFAMFALYFVARRYRSRHAKLILYSAFFLGFVFGTTRVMQGWHYMSHTLWSAIVVWLSILLTALAFYGRKTLDQPPVIQKYLTKK